MRALIIPLFLSAVSIGSVSAQTVPLRITMPQAIALAVQNNVTLRVAKAQSEAARARALQAASQLLPHLTATASQTRNFRTNIDALEGPGLLPFSFLPAFSTFDARLTLVQEIFNWSAQETRRSQKQREESARLRQTLAEEQVAAAAGLAYVEALRSGAAIEAVLADERLAKELLSLAEDRHSAGAATGLDVAREKTRVAQEHSRVLYAQVAGAAAQLRLAHIAGLSLDRELRLDSAFAVSAATVPSAGPSISEALRNRTELALGRAELDAADYSLQAARFTRLPVVAVNGQFAISGNEPDSKSGSVGSMGIGLALPLFEGGALTGKIREARAALDEAAARLDDMTVQVEEDVRLSLKRFEAALEQVQTAELALGLAGSELEMAQGRFAAGVGDNVELVNAQTALSVSRSTRVDALAQYNNARINLALALGRMRSM
ncbi:MAG: TolC family protein [Elusimicrobiales bacterium]|nr:TolC family protein [Elusimicrobiales bacterium]